MLKSFAYYDTTDELGAKGGRVFKGALEILPVIRSIPLPITLRFVSACLSRMPPELR